MIDRDNFNHKIQTINYVSLVQVGFDVVQIYVLL